MYCTEGMIRLSTVHLGWLLLDTLKYLCLLWEGSSYKVGQCLSSTHPYFWRQLILYKCCMSNGICAWQHPLPLGWCGFFRVPYSILTLMFLLLQKLSRGTWQKRIGSQRLPQVIRCVCDSCNHFPLQIPSYMRSCLWLPPHVYIAQPTTQQHSR